MQNKTKSEIFFLKDMKFGVGGAVGRIGEGLEDRPDCISLN